MILLLLGPCNIYGVQWRYHAVLDQIDEHLVPIGVKRNRQCNPITTRRKSIFLLQIAARWLWALINNYKLILWAEKDPCTFHPCLNGGTCEKLQHLHYTCHCPSEYTGSRCEVEVRVVPGKIIWTNIGELQICILFGNLGKTAAQYIAYNIYSISHKHRIRIIF